MVLSGVCAEGWLHYDTIFYLSTSFYGMLSGVCAEGWRDYGTGFCYLPLYGGNGAEKRTWFDAADYCEQRGGQLARIMK